MGRRNRRPRRGKLKIRVGINWPGIRHMALLSMAVVLATALLFLSTGCNGLSASEAYSTQIDRTAAMADELSARASSGRLSSGEMIQGLQWNAQEWRRFKDAKDGREGTPPTTRP